MANQEERQEQRQAVQKRVALKEDGYYANSTMVEITPFDLAILSGKVRPATDQTGQRTLVEMYDRQVYLSHLQARALYEALGKSLSSLGPPGQQGQGWEAKTAGDGEEGIESSIDS